MQRNGGSWCSLSRRIEVGLANGSGPRFATRPFFRFARWHSVSCDCHQSFTVLMVREFLGVLAFGDLLVGRGGGFPNLDQKILTVDAMEDCFAVDRSIEDM
jgi:hypothetical protein